MSRHIQLLISDEFAEKIIPENDSVRLCDDIIDEMDLYSLFRTYSDRGRKYATNPRTLLKILVRKAFGSCHHGLIKKAVRSFAL